MTTTAERFRTLRQAAGLTQVQLAERLGVTQGMVSQIEAGRLDPAAEVMVGYCLAMGWPLAEVIGPERADRLRAALDHAK